MVGHMPVKEAVLYLATLGIGAIEYSYTAIGNTCAMYPLHLPQDDIGLVGITIGLIANQGIAHLLFAEDTL